jgi:anti-anti-sigma regulatory factor
MSLSFGEHFVVELLNSHITIVRFFRPDLRRQLDSLNIEECDLFKEMRAQVLDRLAEGQTVIFNFGLIERFPTAFYQLMVKCRELALIRKAKFILCGFVPEIEESLEILQARRLFDIVKSEEQAIVHAKKNS